LGFPSSSPAPERSSPKGIKKVIQTTIIIPYFLSWILLGAIFIQLFSLYGPMTSVVSSLGATPSYS